MVEHLCGAVLRLAIGYGLALTAPLAALAQQKTIVMLDQAELVPVPEKVVTLAIGNPIVADVTLIAGNLMVVIGKSYGSTNIVAYDRSGRALLSRQIEVQGPAGYIGMVHRGLDRNSYSCTPSCDPRVLLGDSAERGNSSAAGNGSNVGGQKKPGQQTSGPTGPCNSPDDIAADGSRCGQRAASERPGGR